MIRFIKTTTTQPVAAHTARAISTALGSGKRVLWLLSGGSAVQIAADVRRQLATTEGLTVMQVDERFGLMGHKDSNWQQILDAGFETSGVVCHPVLQGNGSLEETAAAYEAELAKALDSADYVIGLFGIGPDGHTAGIFPGSPALDSKQLVYAFQGHDFPRITMTARAITRCNLAIVHAAGQEKAAQLHNLQKDLLPAEQPAQILKQVTETYVYNDAIGEISS